VAVKFLNADYNYSHLENVIFKLNTTTRPLHYKYL